jgi:uncharacterized protein (DUF849 family)
METPRIMLLCMENVIFMTQTADRLFGDDYVWSVLAAGRYEMPFITQAAMLGGHVRVGLEDSLYIGPGQLAKSNWRKGFERAGRDLDEPVERVFARNALRPPILG